MACDKHADLLTEWLNMLRGYPDVPGSCYNVGMKRQHFYVFEQQAIGYGPDTLYCATARSWSKAWRKVRLLWGGELNPKRIVRAPMVRTR